MPETPAPRRSATSVLAVDIGGTKIALRHEGGDRRAYEAVVRWPEGGGLADDVAVLRDAVRGAGGPPASAGFAFPGTLDPAGTVVSWPTRPSWVGLDWTGLVADLLPGVPADTADDGDLAALAEAAHAGSPDVVYFGVGTGVGGGLVRGGRSLPERGSCEVGHVVVALDGPRCDCGRRGCLQAFASGRAVLDRASRSCGRPVDYEELRRGWRAGAPWADVAVRRAGRALAAAVVSVGELVGVELAVIGGGFAAGLPDLAAVVADRVAEYRRPGHRVPTVRAAALGGGSSLHGALLLAGRVGAGR